MLSISNIASSKSVFFSSSVMVKYKFVNFFNTNLLDSQYIANFERLSNYQCKTTVEVSV